jgi:hypothetical protein
MLTYAHLCSPMLTYATLPQGLALLSGLLGEGSEDEDDILGDMNSDDDSDSEDDESGTFVLIKKVN